MMQLPSIIRSIYITPPHDNHKKSLLSPSTSPSPQKKLLETSPALQRANTFSRFRTSSMRTHHRAKSDTSPIVIRKALTPDCSPKPVRKTFSLRRKKSKREDGKEPRVYITPSFRKVIPNLNLPHSFHLFLKKLIFSELK